MMEEPLYSDEAEPVEQPEFYEDRIRELEAERDQYKLWYENLNAQHQVKDDCLEKAREILEKLLPQANPWGQIYIAKALEVLEGE